MRPIALLTALILTSAVATATAEQWDIATKTGESSAGDPMLIRCHYETTGGYRFSIVIRGSCPYVVKINPETGQVRTS